MHGALAAGPALAAGWVALGAALCAVVAGAARAGGAWGAGVAWAGIRGVGRVEVSTDDGATWQDARLYAPLSPWAWTQWAYRWTPPRPGRYAVRCRATDSGGTLQDARRRPPHPSGASGYHRVEITVA